MTLDEILAKYADTWDLYEPATDAQRATARTSIKNLPIELEHFYARSDGADIGDISIFHVDDELLDVNKARTAKTRPFVFFASDGGDGFFAIDTQAKLRHGIGAVYWADRGSAALRSWIYCAASFAAFLEALGVGAKPWKASSLAQVDLDAMAAAFAKHHDRWTGGAPLGPAETTSPAPKHRRVSTSREPSTFPSRASISAAPRQASGIASR